MSQTQRTSSTESNDAIRKRVCKACDRCRLKKSKCDGSTPCSRCKADNAICVFGERKKSHDKIYPKGYVEMLEQQQGQLVSGLQAMYQRMIDEHIWDGPELAEASGHPLTHDILAALHLLEPKHDGSGEMEKFEDDFDKLQSRILASGAGYMQRRSSFSSESEQSQHGTSRLSVSSVSTAIKTPTFNDNFNFGASPSPLAQSPVPRQRLPYPTPQHSPLYQTFPVTTTDSQLYQSEWTISDPIATMPTKFGSQGPQLQEDLDDVENIMGMEQWGESPGPYELCVVTPNSYPMQLSNGFGSLPEMQDYCGGIDPMEMDYQRFIQTVS